MENKKLDRIYPRTLAKLTGQVGRLFDVKEKFGDLPKTFFSSFTKPIGLEFEVEGIQPHLDSYRASLQNPVLALWAVEQDGSLRNGGVEFISSPLVGENIDYALHELETVFSILEGKYNRPPKASVRTSIHIHADVSEWGIRDVYLCTALYALFEPLFFSLQPLERILNPYCWEITDILPEQLGVHKEFKYCALNLAPIERQFSIEFRHGAFSTDMRVNRRWIQVVCKFMKFVEENRENLQKIIEDTILYEDYFKLFLRVFGKSSVLFNKDSVLSMMKENAMWTTLVLELL